MVLPCECIEVEGQMILPEKLADAYDEWFPPRSPLARVTERSFEYDLVYRMEISNGAPALGLMIRHDDCEWTVLKDIDVFIAVSKDELPSVIESTKCNRYDVIHGWMFTFVIDKLKESMSVRRARFRIDDTTFCDEIPILGRHSVYLEPTGKVLGSTHFPFVPFNDFWSVWEYYVQLRKRQVDEIRNAEQDVTPNA
jgi:hypothetical protein